MYTLLIHKLRKMLDAREISVRELVDAYMDRIDKLDRIHKNDRTVSGGGLNAYVYVNSDGITGAIDAAQARIDAGDQKLLTGIPIALSDNLCTEDMPTTCASRMLEDFRPPCDATVVSRLRAQHAIFLGKLNIDEFSMGASTLNSFYGRTKNPYDYLRVSGGASGGAAAAVAAGLCAAAFGFGAGGSISGPAAFCGVTGFRPSYGAVSRHGCAAYASCYDQAAPIATGAADCATLLEAVAGYCPHDIMTSIYDNGDASQARARGEVAGNAAHGGLRYIGHGYMSHSGHDDIDLKGVKLGLIRELLGDEIDPQVREKVNGAAKWYEQAGAEIHEVSIPMLRYGAAAFHLIASAEASTNLARLDGVRYGRRAATNSDYFNMVSKSRGEGFGWEVKRRILFGTCVLSHEYYDKYYKQAVSIANGIRAQYDDALRNIDALLSPAAPGCAYPANDVPDTSNAPNASNTSNASNASNAPNDVNMDDVCSVGPSLAGLPSISTPCGYVSSPAPAPRVVLPVGLMITGKRMGDAFTLGLAQAYEQEFTRIAPPIADGWKGF